MSDDTERLDWLEAVLSGRKNIVLDRTDRTDRFSVDVFLHGWVSNDGTHYGSSLRDAIDAARVAASKIDEYERYIRPALYKQGRCEMKPVDK